MESDEMKAREARGGKRLPYEKPAAVDIGAVATVLGASCSGPGNSFSSGNCNPGGSAGNVCNAGTYADHNCSPNGLNPNLGP